MILLRLGIICLVLGMALISHLDTIGCDSLYERIVTDLDAANFERACPGYAEANARYSENH